MLCEDPNCGVLLGAMGFDECPHSSIFPVFSRAAVLRFELFEQKRFLSGYNRVYANPPLPNLEATCGPSTSTIRRWFESMSNVNRHLVRVWLDDGSDADWTPDEFVERVKEDGLWDV